jgi:molecular chaperone GrpE (heat shock protein)
VVPVADRAKDGWVVEEVLRGYRMGNALLRAAQVRVGRFQQEQSSSTSL